MKDLTTKEAAALLDTTDQILVVNIHRGRLKAHKRGSMWFVKQKDLVAYVNLTGGRLGVKVGSKVNKATNQFASVCVNCSKLKARGVVR